MARKKKENVENNENREEKQLSDKEILQIRFDEYEAYYAANGMTDEILSAYVMLVDLALGKMRDTDIGLKASASIKSKIEQYCLEKTNGTIWQLEEYAVVNKQQYSLVNAYYSVLLAESYDRLESFIRYMEKNREPEKRFYHPRRKVMDLIVKDLEDLENDKIDFYGLSMPSRVGKSTICIFFLCWVAMKKPNSNSAMGGHTGVLAKSFYKELLNFIVSPEYTFNEIYLYWHPNHTVIRDKSSEEYTITLDDAKRFATITCRGADASWTGVINISNDGYLYVDDLIKDREQSLSPQRMETTYQEYQNKMLDRRNNKSKTLMVGTLWNVLDPLERERKLDPDNPRRRFRRIPALNENDESNFDYEINGFSTQYYRETRDRLDKADFEAKFMQRPFVREGILMPTDELRYFNGILPEGDYRKVAVVDVAWGGGDSLSMPIGAEYENGDVYVFDWVFNKGVKEITLPLVTGRIMANDIRQIRFEGDTGGNMYCQYVDEKLSEMRYKCSCTNKKAPNNMEKVSKIIAYSGDIKRKFIFIDPKMVATSERLEEDAKNGIKRYYRHKEYQDAMDEMTTFVTIGKNEHDDAIDGLTQLAMFIENPSDVATVSATNNPYRVRY